MVQGVLGGELVEVDTLARGTQNTHEAKVRPTMMLKVRRADALIVNGLDLDIWADAVVRGANNARIVRGAPGFIDVSGGIPLLDVPTTRVDRSMGDVHPLGNPHYTLDPMAAGKDREGVVRCIWGSPLDLIAGLGAERCRTRLQRSGFRIRLIEQCTRPLRSYPRRSAGRGRSPAHCALRRCRGGLAPRPPESARRSGAGWPVEERPDAPGDLEDVVLAAVTEEIQVHRTSAPVDECDPLVGGDPQQLRLEPRRLDDDLVRDGK